MFLVTSSQMQGLDREAIEGYGIPGIVLMENAGRSIAHLIMERFPASSRQKVVIFIGPGNNGGDGFVIARHLHQAGFHVQLVVLAPAEKFRGDALTNYNIVKHLQLPLIEYLDSESLDWAERLLREANLVVDAIFGTGLKREVSGRFKAAIDLINRSGLPVVAVDIASGLSSDTGFPLGAAVKANVTVTMAFAKLGQALYPGKLYTGELRVMDIGIPKKVGDDAGIKCELLERSSFNGLVKERPEEGHKGTFGHLMILAGSRGKSGAAALCAIGALRSGTGLVTVGCPEGIQGVLSQKLTEAMTRGFCETGEGVISKENLDDILSTLERMAALAIGPGFGTSKDSEYIVKSLVEKAPCGMIIDADALTCIGEDHSCLKLAAAPRILTPHPGEMARLLGCSSRQVQNDRVAMARELAVSTNAIVVLKGAATVIAEPNGFVSINSTGNPGMGTGGMGDVLTGIIGGLLAQGLSPRDSARLGVFVHGLAADQVSDVKGPWGYQASEVANWLPNIWKQALSW